jgi:FMN-dependent NADH-azoreductase
MAKLMYIEASSRRDRSKSTQVAHAFLESYKQAHTDDAVEHLNLFEADIPAFTGPTIKAKYTMMAGEDFSSEEKQDWRHVEKLIADFKDADKYLMSVPMWNFSIPYRLKQYVDNLVQPGYTFKVVEDGYEGLVKDKPMTVIYARGGAYSEGTGKVSSVSKTFDPLLSSRHCRPTHMKYKKQYRPPKRKPKPWPKIFDVLIV